MDDTARDARDVRDFLEFRAETKLKLEHIGLTLERLHPLLEARSGERVEMQAMARDVGELRKEGAVMRSEIKTASEAADARMDRLEDRQKRTLSIMLGVSLALQAVGGLLVWALNAGVLKLSGAP